RRSRVLLLCPPGPPLPAGIPGRLPHASEAHCGLHALAPPYHAPAAGGAERAAALPLAPPVGRHRSARRVGATRAPAHPPTSLDDARAVCRPPGGALRACTTLPRDPGGLADADGDVGHHPPGG